ncbi:hypothetical protein Tsubulata_036103 [Turnera subulata]|uniref:Uncharacterized protein n=1 Tax=Turnera subulata TaxID=218843 RepID=A0A9Q0JBN6_9ROSI|nr:hypothetical protein Tsubulata_036103 [Turnera subulata]
MIILHHLRILRKHAPGIKPLVAMNKCESLCNGSDAIAEARKLVFGDAIAISAETGLGMIVPYETLKPLLEDYMLRFLNSKGAGQPWKEAYCSNLNDYCGLNHLDNKPTKADEGQMAVMHQIANTYKKEYLRLPTTRLNRWLRKLRRFFSFHFNSFTIFTVVVNGTHFICLFRKHSWKDRAAQTKIKYFIQVK